MYMGMVLRLQKSIIFSLLIFVFLYGMPGFVGAQAVPDADDSLITNQPVVDDYNYVPKEVTGNTNVGAGNTNPKPPSGPFSLTNPLKFDSIEDFLLAVIEVILGQPSLGEFAVVGDTDLHFATNVVVTGKVHANGGIRFDGLAQGLVTSALTTYTDPSHGGGSDHAVHTHVPPADPLPPTALPSRPDVFVGGRTFPVPAFDFDGLWIYWAGHCRRGRYHRLLSLPARPAEQTTGNCGCR